MEQGFCNGLCPIDRLAVAAAGRIAAERPVDRRYRSMAAGATAAYQLQARSEVNAGRRTGGEAQRRLVSYEMHKYAFILRMVFQYRTLRRSGFLISVR